MSVADELERLADMHHRGVLSDAEFERAKDLVLSGRARAYGADVQRSLNQLRRSRHDQYFGGVCGGFAEATGLPSWLWRALVVVLGLSFGVGVAIYVALWVLIPPDASDPADHEDRDDFRRD